MIDKIENGKGKKKEATISSQKMITIMCLCNDERYTHLQLPLQASLAHLLFFASLSVTRFPPNATRSQSVDDTVTQLYDTATHMM